MGLHPLLISVSGDYNLNNYYAGTLDFVAYVFVPALLVALLVRWIIRRRRK